MYIYLICFSINPKIFDKGTISATHFTDRFYCKHQKMVCFRKGETITEVDDFVVIVDGGGLEINPSESAPPLVLTIHVHDITISLKIVSLCGCHLKDSSGSAIITVVNTIIITVLLGALDVFHYRLQSEFLWVITCKYFNHCFFIYVGHDRIAKKILLGNFKTWRIEYFS